jgi:hypothetical protein
VEKNASRRARFTVETPILIHADPQLPQSGETTAGNVALAGLLNIGERRALKQRRAIHTNEAMSVAFHVQRVVHSSPTRGAFSGSVLWEH